MRTRFLILATVVLMTVSSQTAAADGAWERGNAGGWGVEASSHRDTARVEASTGSSQPGAPAVGEDYVAFDPAPVGPEQPVVATQVCRRTNPGEVDPQVHGSYTTVCYTPNDPSEPAPPGEDPVAVDPRSVAASAAAQLTVPPPVLSLNPDPANNQWNAWPIALPIGIGVDEPVPVSTTSTSGGVLVDLTATRGQIHLNWGDGTSSVCTSWDTQPRTDARVAPVCGHSYQNPGQYTITATAAWTITWHALDQTGTLPATSSSTHPITIKEFQAVITG